MNYYEYGLILFFLFITILILGYLSISPKEISKGNLKETAWKKVLIKETEYNLEIAGSEESRRIGLMNRKNMPELEGMLFVFEQPDIHGFWMKNTLIPLDMVWINDKGVVVYIYENAKPCSNFVTAVCQSIIPTKIAKYVIELNAGQVKKLGLSAGGFIQL